MQTLNKLAQDALTEYHREISAGGEPTYPKWAQEWMDFKDAADETARQLAALQEDYRDLAARQAAL